VRINQEKCTGCEMCIDACPSSAISCHDGQFEISEELCLNILFCSAAYACPVQAIERVEQGKEAVRCDNCVVQCEIAPNRVDRLER
jgi:ferredoxin